MSGTDGDEPAPPSQGAVTVQNGPQQELFPAATFLEIERQRIDSYNRRTEVASQAVAASNESDRRQFDFQMAKLSAEDGGSKRRDSLARILLISGGIISTLVLGLFLYMAFFGNPTQSAIALQIVKTLAIGGGGFGIISAVLNASRRLIHNK